MALPTHEKNEIVASMLNYMKVTWITWRKLVIVLCALVDTCGLGDLKESVSVGEFRNVDLRCALLEH